MTTNTFTAIVYPEDDGYVSECLELGVASQGDTVQEALAMLKEAVRGYLESFGPNEQPELRRSRPLVTTIEVTYADTARDFAQTSS